MTNLYKLGIGLTFLFSFSLFALLTELTYVFCFRKRRLRQQSPTGEADTSDEFHSSKNLFYFFCWKKNNCRIEPAGSPSQAHETHRESCELVKWEEIHGPSRLLFTIKEEEREDLESENSLSKRRMVSEVEGEEVIVVVDLETPFTTPCGSPPYYTPAASPPPEEKNVAFSWSSK